MLGWMGGCPARGSDLLTRSHLAVEPSTTGFATVWIHVDTLEDLLLPEAIRWERPIAGRTATCRADSKLLAGQRFTRSIFTESNQIVPRSRLSIC